MGDPVCQWRHLRLFVRVNDTAPNAPKCSPGWGGRVRAGSRTGLATYLIRSPALLAGCGRKQASVRGGRKTGLATYLIRFAAGPLWGHCGRKQGSVRAGSGPGLATYLIRFAAGPLREEAGKCERRKKDRPGGKLGRFRGRCGSAFYRGLVPGGLCQRVSRRCFCGAIWPAGQATSPRPADQVSGVLPRSARRLLRPCHHQRSTMNCVA